MASNPTRCILPNVLFLPKQLQYNYYTDLDIVSSSTWNALKCLVLLRISKSGKRMDSDGFFLKSADPDSVSDSGWKYYKHVLTDVWFGIRTSNGRKWCKSIPLTDNKHCYAVVVVYLWVSENGVWRGLVL